MTQCCGGRMLLFLSTHIGVFNLLESTGGTVDRSESYKDSLSGTNSQG